MYHESQLELARDLLLDAITAAYNYGLSDDTVLDRVSSQEIILDAQGATASFQVGDGDMPYTVMIALDDERDEDGREIAWHITFFNLLGRVAAALAELPEFNGGVVIDADIEPEGWDNQ